MIVKPLDWVERPPCAECGCTMRIVDGDGKGNYWLLCLDTNNRSCVWCEPLPNSFKVEDIKFDDPPIGTYKPNRCGSYPFMNIAQDFGLPYGVVLLIADYYADDRWDEHVQKALGFAKGTMLYSTFKKLYEEILNATRSDGNA